MTQEEKQIAHDILCKRYDETAQKAVAAIEPRLKEYFDGLRDEPSAHNAYEILCGVKFLRLLRTYEFNERKVRQVVRLREGEWKQDSRGRWIHVSGGIQCPGTDTAHVYRWQPFQVFVLASVFGFHTWFNTEVQAIDKPHLLPTEREREDGFVEDFRRLCNYFVMYTPRKTDKTGMSAYIQLCFFLLGDYNSEIYCCANAEFQAKILYTRVQFMLRDVDTKHRFRMTAKITDWKPQYRNIRNASIMPLTAGGKAKDGPFAELVNWDELGSSPYVNGKSDMMGLVNVMRSSMGPRREGLTFGTTTAGTISAGPFIDMLDKLHSELLREIKYESGEETPSLSDDRSLCLLLEPDDWEKKDIDDYLESKELRRKINPMLGITCQHQFYDDSLADVRQDKMTVEEYVSKLLNTYRVSNKQEWIKPEVIRGLQVNVKIDDINSKDGWVVFCGMDFSMGDDLHALVYLAKNLRTGEFFADMDAWITEQTLNDSPIKHMYLEWIKRGDLHVSPGATLQPTLPVDRIAELSNHLLFLGFGYDPYKAKEPINALRAWVFTMGKNPDDYLLPVRQNFASYNPVVEELDYMINSDPSVIHFSGTPMWLWEFGNVALQVSTDGMENKKPVKSNPNSKACKVDHIQCLCNGMMVYDLVNSKITK